jgi:hypothetical protein
VVPAVVALVTIAASLYKSRPRFSGSSPSAIEVIVYKPGSRDIAYQTTVTNRPASDSILKEFTKAHFNMNGRKADGEFIIRYDDGKTDRVPFEPGRIEGWYKIYHHGFYSIPSERFFQVLHDGGVDVSRIPRN